MFGKGWEEMNHHGRTWLYPYREKILQLLHPPQQQFLQFLLVRTHT